MNKDFHPDTNKHWVERFDQWRGHLVLATGGTIIDLIGLLGALLPWVLISALLYGTTLKAIIPDDTIRLLISPVLAFVVEAYAIAVMVLEYRVSMFNNQYPDNFLAFNAGSSKAFYLILIIAIVLTGHIIPLLGGGEVVASFSLLFMIGISWGSYKLFSVGFSLREARKQLNEQYGIELEVTQLEYKSKELDVALATAEAEKMKQIASAERARTRREKAKVTKPKSGKETPAFTTVDLPKTVNDWLELSFEAAQDAIIAGATPPEIKHLDTWERYSKLKGHLEETGKDIIKTNEAAKLLETNSVRVRKDMKLLHAVGIVKLVSNGNYQFNGQKHL